MSLSTETGLSKHLGSSHCGTLYLHACTAVPSNLYFKSEVKVYTFCDDELLNLPSFGVSSFLVRPALRLGRVLFLTLVKVSNLMYLEPS